MTISKLSTLVTSTWLKEQICSLSTKKTTGLGQSLRVLDTSWMPNPEVDGYKDFYKVSHIPQSVYFDLKHVSPGHTGTAVKFPIPDDNYFQDYVESLGISNHTHVVAYDRQDTKSSFRTWFLFRLFGHDKVSVLSGGMRQWLVNGFHVTTDEPSFEEGKFEVKFRPHLLRNYNTMLENVNTRSEQVMDSRGRDNFYAYDNPKGGHIPGSKCIPFKTLFNEDGTVKSENDLKKLFEDAGVDLRKPLVSSCMTAMTACGLIAAAHILGKEDVPLYNGSFTEWSALADPSYIAKGGDERESSS